MIKVSYKYQAPLNFKYRRDMSGEMQPTSPAPLYCSQPLHHSQGSLPPHFSLGPC